MIETHGLFPKRGLLPLGVFVFVFGWFVLSQPNTIGQVPPDDSQLARRLQIIQELVEIRRVHHRIPGIALGIVRDGDVVLAEGFGSLDLKTNIAVTPETVFQIASATKPLTSTMMSMLATEGKIDLDDPITKYGPDLEFSNQNEPEITLRDLLCHRSGFGRMPILQMGDHEREQIVRHATGAKPRATNRQVFQYSNVMFTAAGIAAARSVDQTWDQAMRERVFLPLGMSKTTTSIDQIKSASSVGYRWDATLQRHEPIPLVNADSIGPAGSINSTVVDLCKWIQLLLNGGRFDGKQLVDTSQIETTWTPQIENYGLGWILQERHGTKVVEHGGNLGGFSSQVTLAPQRGLGYVLLTNLDYTPFQKESINLILDALLLPMPEVESEFRDSVAMRELDTNALQGTYVGPADALGNVVARISSRGSGIEMELGPRSKMEFKAWGSSGLKFRSLDQSSIIEFGAPENGMPPSMLLVRNGRANRLNRVSFGKQQAIAPINLETIDGRYFYKPWKFPIQVSFHEDC